MSMQESVSVVWKDYDNYIKQFSRDSYGEAFESFCSANGAFLEEICKDPAGASLAGDALAASFREILEKETARNKRTNLQMNGNLFLVAYIFPAFFEKLSGEQAKQVIKDIADAWEKEFPGNHLEGASRESIQEGFRKKLCYITTAVCENRKMGIDCEELNLIRSFRDGYMAGSEEGRALIDEYYDIAPTIVKRIDKSSNADKVYQMILQEYILPCVDKIKTGDLSGCMSTYCKMVENLRELFIYHYKRG
ncbi:MAG: hypothetical protein K5682_03340 [Lachnospiraceae bacterium]|nr:hypothetical protein [Lachnospiraceae bacterium]